MSMIRSRRELSINMVIYRFIFKNSQITLLLRFTFIPETSAGLPKTTFFKRKKNSINFRKKCLDYFSYNINTSNQKLVFLIVLKSK